MGLSFFSLYVLHVDSRYDAQWGYKGNWDVPTKAIQPLLKAGSDGTGQQCSNFFQTETANKYAEQHCTLVPPMYKRTGVDLSLIRKGISGLTSLGFFGRHRMYRELARQATFEWNLDMQLLPMGLIQALTTVPWVTKPGMRYHVGSSANKRFFSREEMAIVAEELEDRIQKNVTTHYELMPYGAPDGQAWMNKNGATEQAAYNREGKVFYVDDWVYYKSAQEKEEAEHAWRSILKVQPWSMGLEKDMGSSYPGTGSSIELNVERSQEASSSTTSGAGGSSWTNASKLILLKKYYSEKTLANLQEIKTKYDPTDLFSSKLTIPPLLVGERFFSRSVSSQVYS